MLDDAAFAAWSRVAETLLGPGDERGRSIRRTSSRTTSEDDRRATATRFVAAALWANPENAGTQTTGGAWRWQPGDPRAVGEVVTTLSSANRNAMPRRNAADRPPQFRRGVAVQVLCWLRGIRRRGPCRGDRRVCGRRARPLCDLGDESAGEADSIHKIASETPANSTNRSASRIDSRV